MQWILACLLYLLQLSKCQPIIQKAPTKPAQWQKAPGRVVYPQLHLVDGLKIKSPDSNTHSVLILKTPPETFYIELKPNEDLFRKNQSSLPSRHSTAPCHFHGSVLSHADGMAAISMCDSRNRMTGTIMVRNETFILNPLNHRDNNISVLPLQDYSNSEIEPHVLSKLEDPLSRFCGIEHNALDATDIPSEENEIRNHSRFRRSITSGTKTIETAVFVDYPLYKKYKFQKIYPTEELIDVVLAIINQVQLIFNYQSMKTKFRIVIVKLEILSSGKDAPDPAEGDIDKYLDDFCQWQAAKNSPDSSEEHWDHALLLTGYDLFKLVNGTRNHKVLGLGWVNGMCRANHSCTINEGSSFEAAFVIAHELGHSLGMMHDGTGNECDPTGYLMAEKTGPGRTSWSKCSNDYLEKFFKRGRGACLEDDNTNELEKVRYSKARHILPGYRFDLDDQCRMSLGENFRPHIMPKRPFNNVCRELWCVSGLWASVAHPALEGSSCDSGKECFQGICKSIQPEVEDKSEGQSTKDIQTALTNFVQQLKSAFHFMLP